MSGVVCHTCGGTAEVHMTEVRPDGTKHSHHYCARHAAAAGAPISAAKIEAHKTAMEAFVQFVQRERRAPTKDELARLGLTTADPDDDGTWVAQLEKMAEFVLQHPDT